MTVQAQIPHVTYAANGVTTVFAYPFRILAETHLQVYLDAVLTPGGYTVAGVNVQGGGTVTFTVAPLDGVVVEIRRTVPATQEVDYQPYDAFPAETHETALDKLTMLIQDLGFGAGSTQRNLRLQDNEPLEPNVDMRLPFGLDTRRGRILGFDPTTGNPIFLSANTPTYGLQRQLVTAVAGQTVFPLSLTYVPGMNAIAVYVNGLRQVSGADFTETDANTVTMTYPLQAGDEVEFLAGVELADGMVADASTTSFIQAGAGAVAYPMQDKARQVVSVKDYGATGDGVTDDTAALLDAIAYCRNGVAALYFPAGTYCFDMTTADSPDFGLYVGQPLTIYGDGITSTILKNMSATAAGIRCAATVNLSGFTLDQNGGAGRGLQIFAQYSQINLRVTRQGGDGSIYAVYIDGATCTNATIEIIDSAAGLCLGELFPTFYVRLCSPTIEVHTGIHCRMYACAACDLDIYLEANTTGGANLRRFLDIDNCVETTLRLTCETTDTHNLVDPAYFMITNSKAIKFRSGRVNHTGTAGRALFRLHGAASNGISWDGFEILSTRSGMTLFDFNAQALVYDIGVKNIVTYLTSPAYGVLCNTAVAGLHIADWWDSSNNSEHVLNASDLLGENISGPIAVAVQSRQTFINCPGPFSDAGAETAVRINSNGTERGIRGIRKKVVKFTRDMAAASGTVAYGGFGFQPQSLSFTSAIDGGGGHSVGFAYHTGNGGAAGEGVGQGAGGGAWVTVSSPTVVVAGADAAFANAQYGAITAINSDGFTISWTKYGAPTGTLTLIVLGSQ